MQRYVAGRGEGRTRKRAGGVDQALEAARVMWVKEKQTRNPDTRNKSGNRGGRQTIGLG